MKAVDTMEAMQSMVLQLRTGLEKSAKGGAMITRIFYTHTHIYTCNVIIYALYIYTIYTNPHWTDEIGSGCLRGDMM